jgi:hypothetical protein
VQIRERFPKGLKRKNGVAYSNGLEDCLFPLIYKGYINHLIAKARRVGLDDEIEQCFETLDRNQNYIKSIGQKLRDNLMDDKTFDLLVKDSMVAGKKVSEKLKVLQEEANSIDRVDVPKNLYADYASHKLSDELKRRLFRAVIDHVDVWHTHIVVHLKRKGKFTIKRTRMGKTYVLPSWRIVEDNKDSYETIYSQMGISKMKHKRTLIREDSNINVVYEYDNVHSMKVVYGDENLIVMTEGVKK